jgi:hypothetical protein
MLRGASRTNPRRTTFYGTMPKSVSLFYPVEAPGKIPGPWRHLEVESRPETLHLRWNEQPMDVPLPPLQLTIWRNLLESDYPDLRRIPLELLPRRGALGLYLYGSSVTVRRFRIEPLDP